MTGILEVEDPAAEARRYRIPDGHEEVLTERDNLNYLAPFARMMVGIVRPLPAVMEAFRSGAESLTRSTTPISARARPR